MTMSIPTDAPDRHMMLLGRNAQQHPDSGTFPMSEEEWCPFCSRGDDRSGGMPREIIHHTVGISPTWDIDADQPHYDITLLSCGHSLVQPCLSW